MWCFGNTYQKNTNAKASKYTSSATNMPIHLTWVYLGKAECSAWQSSATSIILNLTKEFRGKDHNSFVVNFFFIPRIVCWAQRQLSYQQLQNFQKKKRKISLRISLVQKKDWSKPCIPKDSVLEGQKEVFVLTTIHSFAFHHNTEENLCTGIKHNN